VKLTQRTLETLELPAGKADHIEFDDAVPGFGVRIRSTGARTFVFQYKLGGRNRRMTFGKAAALPLSQARKMAGELYAKVRLGRDPRARKTRDESVRLKLSALCLNLICHTNKRTCGRAPTWKLSATCCVTVGRFIDFRLSRLIVVPSLQGWLRSQ
jgi:hypothetical protein